MKKQRSLNDYVYISVIITIIILNRFVMENTEDRAPVVVRPTIVCKLKDQSPNTVTVSEEKPPFVFWF